MSKDSQPDNRRARKKKNLGKLPPLSQAQRDSSNLKEQVEVKNED